MCESLGLWTAENISKYTELYAYDLATSETDVLDKKKFQNFRYQLRLAVKKNQDKGKSSNLFMKYLKYTEQEERRIVMHDKHQLKVQKLNDVINALTIKLNNVQVVVAGAEEPVVDWEKKYKQEKRTSAIHLGVIREMERTYGKYKDRIPTLTDK